MATDGQEARVDSMIAEGRAILSEAIERWRPAVIIAAYSGGDDSMVSMHFTMTQRPDAVVFNADTLIGLVPARGHIERTCQRFRWDLEVGKAVPVGCPEKRRIPGVGMIPFEPARDLYAGEWREGATAFEERTLNFGFPGRNKKQHAIMYQRLKEKPIRRFVKQFGVAKADGKPKALIVSGIRGDESSVRAGYKRASAEGTFGDIWVNPFYYRIAADFAAYRDEFGLPSNPVKSRCGISGECACLTFPRDSDAAAEKAAFASVDPEFGRYIDGLERKVKEVFPWGYGESPPSWWMEAKRGQSFMSFMADEMAGCKFQPMCIGCHRGK